MPILDRSRFDAHFFQDILANIRYTILYYKKREENSSMPTKVYLIKSLFYLSSLEYGLDK